MENEEHYITDGVYYIHHRDHRNNNPEKSQWTIGEQAERTSFEWAFNSWSESKYTCWELHFVEGNVAYLGHTKSSAPKQRNLFIAKFLDSSKNSTWHGYPSDHVENHQDIPPEDILNRWVESGYIRLATSRKIIEGKKCKL